MICETLSCPYVEIIWSMTFCLLFIQKSISKSGIDILSGFKNLSKRRLYLIGSMFVMPRTNATSEPAPEPLPGPTGTSLFLAHKINS